jgi:CDP-glucose 4,6-dehydratase
MGARVSGFALSPPTEPNFFTTAGVNTACRTIIGDIRDASALAAAVADAKPDIVLHLAAQPLVRLAHATPVETYATNLMGTVHLLDAVRKTPSSTAVVAITTDKVYDNKEWSRGYQENDTLGGREPYGNSKACAEFAVEAYRRSYFEEEKIGIATVRAGNVIGGGDWASDRLIPDAMRAFAIGHALKIRHPDAVRPFQHVLDPVRGMLMLAERLSSQPGEFATGWNFGPAEDDSRSVGWMAERLAQLWSPEARWLAEPSVGPHEARLLTLSSAQAQERLSWYPTWNADKAITRTVNWYRAFYEKSDIATLTHMQIDEHEAEASAENGHERQDKIEAKSAA